MRKEHRLEAYLDDYDHLNVYVARNYYDGESKFFYLKDPSGKLHPLTIGHMSQDDKYCKYALTRLPGIEIGQAYQVLEEHGKSCPLQYGLIVRTDRFNEEFFNDRNDFGAHYIDGKTRFVLWAPTASRVDLELLDGSQRQMVTMTREEKGAYVYELDANWHNKAYCYYVHVNGQVDRALDPYGYGSTSNGASSVMIDFNQIEMDFKDDHLPVLKHKCQAIIGEVSVRDFTMDPAVDFDHRGQFLGMIEQGKTTGHNQPAGFDYLVSLGYTHVQLMPIYDFATVDEDNPTAFYNWGYDPSQYNALEGSYSTNPNDGLSRVKELMTLVCFYHSHGLRVVMDVVYNHMYDLLDSSFEQIVPYYYFRMNKEGHISNGSFCGNDVDSSNAMVRKFIIDSLVHFVKHYHMDGFRFDLMGILDIDTLNQAVDAIHQIRPDALVYGEGWNMPTMLDESKRATRENCYKMPEVGFFNDFYRDHVKGPTSSDKKGVKGYCLGDANYYAAFRDALLANTGKNAGTCLFNDPSQSVNYLECHDNMTLWDKIQESNKEESKIEMVLRQKLCNGALLLSQGMAFLHYGQEACRTKMGVENSYMSSDAINRVSYDRASAFHDVVHFTKDMIHLRKSLGVFNFKTAQEIEDHVQISGHHNNQVTHYHLINVKDYCDYEEVSVYFNISKEVVTFDLGDGWVKLANEFGLVQKQACDQVIVNPISLVVVARKKDHA